MLQLGYFPVFLGLMQSSIFLFPDSVYKLKIQASNSVNSYIRNILSKSDTNCQAHLFILDVWN
jgi:hypothetical protein